MAAAVVATSEWLRAPSVTLACVTAACCLAAAVMPGRLDGWRRTCSALALLAIGVTVLLTQRALWLIETDWPRQLNARVTAASARLGGDLHAAYHLAERLAAAGSEASASGQAVAFRQLAAAVPGRGVESGVAILNPDGTPWAWAGRQRLFPLLTGDSLAARNTGYYLVLETRRHSARGRVTVASVLIWAHPAVADRSRSLAELFRMRTEVGLEVYPAGAGPNTTNIFDYTEPTTAGDRVLFSTQPIPPSQSEARTLALLRGSRPAAWLLLVALALSITLMRTVPGRFAALAPLLWLVVRAPLGQILGVHAPFSAAMYSLGLLGPFSSSAAALTLTGALLVIGAAPHRLRSRPPRWLSIGVPVLISLGTPVLVRLLSRGIAPPPGGVSMGLWMTWQLTLFLPAAGLILLASTVVRARGTERAGHWGVVMAGVIAVAAGATAIWVWQPVTALPEWLPWLWVPAIALVTLPAPRWTSIAGTAVVAGTLAAACTWSAAVTGRVAAAQRDIGRLGNAPDSAAIPLLQRFDTDLGRAPTLSRQSAMYALWRRSALWSERYPARLTLWTTDGNRSSVLPLDVLSVPDSALAPLVRSLRSDQQRTIVTFPGVPGTHYALVARADSGSVLTVVIGPRSALVAPSRLGRLLHPVAEGSPLYRLTLAPPSPVAAAAASGRGWRREGWSALSERSLLLPDGPHELRSVVDLRGPVPILVRGSLLVSLDLAVTALLMVMAQLVVAGPTRRPRWAHLMRSFRVRLTIALAAFFILPTVAFAAWTVSHFQEEAQRGRDLLITQSLRDPALTASPVATSLEVPSDSMLRMLSQRINADLALYRGGSFVAASAPILRELGVIGPLMDAGAYEALALNGELEVMRDGAIPSLAERVGYRVIQPGPPERLGVLATPQVAEVAGLGTPAKQIDLALILVLTTLIGMAAAVISAGVAARALSKPVADLRRSALALGQGNAMPLDIAAPPYEFEPVFGAFRSMAADITSSRAALEAARRRTATVLATVATGVVALDVGGCVLIANRQAVDLLGAPLAEGDRLTEVLAKRWSELGSLVDHFLADPVHAQATTELTVEGRRITVQLAPLGPDLSGVVLAFNDVTDLSRAERVLAWGEMARQVAHEIKNPLTPLRLGIQHLQRAHRDGRADFDRTLDETAGRILVEIDRLDTIARAFSRFAAPGGEVEPLERLDLSAVATEVVQLYRLAGESAAVELDAPDHVWVMARRDEVKEVLVNLLENGRNAGGRTISIRVRPGTLIVADDGMGISAEQLPRIFEPRFSTTTSGSGLGLPIVRRLVESWGGTVGVESAVGRGTTVTVELPA
jgi:signal transduction histidine kinase